MNATNRALKCMNQNLTKLKGEIDKSTIIFQGNAPSSVIELVQNQQRSRKN